VSIHVRTLSPQDAEILARTVRTGTVSGGCVECFDLRWRSDALRTWEVQQRALGRRPTVSIRIDELDLSVVYVESLVENDERRHFRAISTQPQYTANLSLFEHKRLKALIKQKGLHDRLIRMADERAFNLRLEYHAALGHADDPVAYRRLVALRDQLAALRVKNSTDDTLIEPALPSEPPPKRSAMKLRNGKRADPGLSKKRSTWMAADPPQPIEHVAPNKPEPELSPSPPEPDPQPSPGPKPEAMPDIPFQHITIKRKPK